MCFDKYGKELLGNERKEAIHEMKKELQKKKHKKSKILVIDPHGDLVKEAKEFRASNRGRLVYIDPNFEFENPEDAIINPLDIDDFSKKSAEGIGIESKLKHT